MDKQAGPPSPTPSGDGHGFRRTTRHSIARAMYTTQTPQYSQAAQLGDFHSQYPHHEMEANAVSDEAQFMPPSRLGQLTWDQQSVDPLGRDMRTAVYARYTQGQRQMNPRPYSTPETSPALTQQLENVRTTRSRVRQSKSGETKKPPPFRSGRVEKPKTKKRKRSDGAGGGDDMIKRPLTDYVSEYPHVKLLDIDSFVRRSTEARHREVFESKDKKVKRPMNAFLLYRKTYQNLAKQLYEDTNHQQISKTCGYGWGIEPPHIKDRFGVLAEIERNNHKIAHPDYKFTPRSAKKAKKVEVESDDDELPDGDEEWVPSRGAASSGRQARNPPQNDAPLSIYDTYQPQENAVGYGPGTVHPNQAMYPHHHHGKGVPMVYDNGTFAGYYHPNVYQATEGVVEDGRSPPPGSFPHNDQYVGEYSMMPTSQYPLLPQVGAEYLVDPSLVSSTQDPYAAGPYEGYGDQAENEAAWAAQAQGMQDSLAPVDDMLVNDPQLGYLKGEDGSWQVEEIPPFDSTVWPAA